MQPCAGTRNRGGERMSYEWMAVMWAVGGALGLLVSLFIGEEYGRHVRTQGLMMLILALLNRLLAELSV